MKKIRDRVTSNKSRHLKIENKLNKLEKFDSSCFKGKSHFEEDGIQNYLVFQSMYRYPKKIAGVESGNYIYIFGNLKVCLMKDLILILHLTTVLLKELRFYGTKTRVEFYGGCLKPDKASYNHGATVIIHIVFEISKNYRISSYPTLENCLFGAVSLIKNADFDQYKYSGCSIGFDRKGEFSFGSRGFGKI